MPISVAQAPFKCGRLSWCVSVLLCLGVTTATTQTRCHATPKDFWERWSDGSAEVNTYELTQPRYGEARRGELHLIYVTEPFSKSRHVKINHYNSDNPDHTIALKLNMVESWRTGVYDYRVMSSHFFDALDGLAPLKVSFSSQEWCGVMYEEAIWEKGALNFNIRSYFEGETGEYALSGDLRPNDQLLTLSRGLLVGGPKGVSQYPNMWIGSAKERRLSHLALTPYHAQIKALPETSIKTALGERRAQPIRFKTSQETRCTLFVEIPAPHRILAWRCDDGFKAEITQSQRSPYWRHTQLKDEGRYRTMGSE